MKQEIMELWTKELTSGFWEQGKYFLEHSGTYCVFGVLCNLAALEGVCDHKGLNVGLFDGQLNLVPDSVMTWAGLKSSNGESSDLIQTLAEMNDKGKSFDYLAKIIKNNWKSL